MGVTANVKLSSFTAGFLLVMVAPHRGLPPHQQPYRPHHHGPARQPHRRRERGHQRHQVQADGLCHLRRAGWSRRRPLCHELPSIAAKKFDFNTSILILVYVVLGGLGNIRGSVIAAALLYVLPELLRDFYDYRMLIYAIVLILVMLATNNERSKEFFSSLRRKILGRGTEKGGAQNG